MYPINERLRKQEIINSKVPIQTLVYKCCK